jgi:tRNA (mo5U34)-methyltransferase
MSLQVPRSADEPADAVSAEIDELAPWFHNLHLPSGHQTAAAHPLGDFPAFKWAQIAGVLDEDLSGARALDIGCNAGFYSFGLAARGAEVLAIDADEHYLRQGRWAARQLDPAGRVRFERMHLYDLVGRDERFDVILFLGVLYHLRYPQLALDLLAPLAGGQMIVQTLTMPSDSAAGEAATRSVAVPADVPFDQRDRLAEPGWPKAAFIERSFAGDSTNWWAPDDACVQAMLRSAGLRVVATPAHETYVCEPEPERDPDWPLRRAELDAATLRLTASGERQPPPGHSSQRK